DGPGGRGRGRHVDAQRVVVRRQSGNPAAPRDGEALPHQEAVAGLLGRRRIVARWRVVELGERAHVAAVVHVIEEGAGAAVEGARFEQVEVGGIFDAAAWVAWRLVKVDDCRIERMRGVERAVETADDLLVGAGRAKTLPGRE